MDKEQKVFSLLGLATRGRNLVSGESQTVDAVRDGSAYLVLVAQDASENTKKLFHDKCEYYEVPVLEFGTKESLGHAIGKEYRSSVAILEEGFSAKISDLLSV